ncbi:MAG TPA: carboxypeptidase-like regulatory domain-containing protein [Gemmatimonadales bacterium]|nr:carboxypeptidase-like regulatory domain-containing protein [Gemmatimonadales bacterium]
MSASEGFLTLAAALAAILSAAPVYSPQPASSTAPVGGGYLSGVVRSLNGPEAGVWVIAETTDLPTKYAKIIVTDESGRYVLPELPAATYTVWARGYGLVDSAKVQTTPGKVLDITAVPAPTAAAAAEYYPAIYWYAMLQVPKRDEFPLGNVRRQEEWLNVVKTNGCYGCHALGNKAMRTIPKEFGELGSSVEAWERRIQSGQAMTQMVTNIGRLHTKRALELFADWTDRIAAGELPAAKPSRPQGVERNIVVTMWDWAGKKDYLHDEIATDRRNPTINANGRIYGATEESTDLFPILDPVTHKATQLRMPVRDPNTPSSKNLPMAPSPYWGAEPIWDSQTSMHNPMMDERGRVWFTSRVGVPDNPEFCRKGSDHPSAKLFPIERSGRHLSMYDPKSGAMTLIRTCFQTHHLIFAEDADNTLWTSSGGPAGGVVGWLNRKTFEETGDEQKSQGWTALVLDTNGNGRRDDYAEPDQPLDPVKDKRVAAALYSVAVSPTDGTVLGTSLGFPGYVVRLAPGAHPPETALAEVYEPPMPGYGPRGGDIDRNGVFWASLASGHLGSFDRAKCKGPLNGPSATGTHCPEGWTLYPFPGPQLMNVEQPGSAEASYYTWVDQYDTFGLGKDVPIATGNANESLLALVNGEWVNLRVPYPLGFYAKWSDGRIDDSAAGWKGKGLWSTTSTRAPFHMEGGKGTRPKVVKFQLRPDPLAR